MKERPIIFNSEQVRAILEGRKTMMRRIVKSKYGKILGCLGNGLFQVPSIAKIPDKWSMHQIKCPHGQVGDRLWVRETFNYDGEHGVVFFKADGEKQCEKWKLSIHMPKWASRITLEITDVRVERVQEIILADVEKEGIVDKPISAPEASSLFLKLWNSLYGKDAWERNDWVWVIEFRRVDNETK